jgi:membrane protein required for colicin V production
MGEPGVRYAAAIALVFVLVLVLAGLVGMMVGGAVRLAGLGVYDRLLGGLFGVTRGLAMLVLLTLLAGLTALPRTTSWQASWAHGALEAMAVRCMPWLPDDIAVLIQFQHPPSPSRQRERSLGVTATRVH